MSLCVSQPYSSVSSGWSSWPRMPWLKNTVTHGTPASTSRRAMQARLPGTVSAVAVAELLRLAVEVEGVPHARRVHQLERLLRERVDAAVPGSSLASRSRRDASRSAGTSGRQVERRDEPVGVGDVAEFGRLVPAAEEPAVLPGRHLVRREQRAVHVNRGVRERVRSAAAASAPRRARGSRSAAAAGWTTSAGGTGRSARGSTRSRGRGRRASSTAAPRSGRRAPPVAAGVRRRAGRGWSSGWCGRCRGFPPGRPASGPRCRAGSARRW